MDKSAVEPIFSCELKKRSHPDITYMAVGDFADSCDKRQSRPGSCTERLQAFLHESHLSSFNLEGPITSWPEPIRKIGPSIKLDCRAVSHIRQCGFNLAVLANNHIFDYGSPGVEETLSTCAELGVHTIGVKWRGTVEENIYIHETDELRVGFVAMCEKELFTDIYEKFDLLSMHDSLFAEQISALKSLVDVLIVNFHGGNEFSLVPNPWTRRIYRLLIDSGADMVVGHHPHVVQGIEIYRDRPILYSLGNFYFPTSGSCGPNWSQGLSAKVNIGREGVSRLEIYGTCFEKGRVDLVEGSAAEDLRSRLRKCSDLIVDDASWSAYWKAFCHLRSDYYLKTLSLAADMGSFNLREALSALLRYRSTIETCLFVNNLKERMVPSRQRQDKRLRILQFLNCPAHREVLTTLMQMRLSAESPDLYILQDFAEMVPEVA